MNHIDHASLAWGLGLGITFGGWLRGTLDALFPPPQRKTPPPAGPGPRFTEGRAIRGNGNGGPSSAKPQFPSPRIIREDFLE